MGTGRAAGVRRADPTGTLHNPMFPAYPTGVGSPDQFWHRFYIASDREDTMRGTILFVLCLSLNRESADKVLSTCSARSRA